MARGALVLALIAVGCVIAHAQNDSRLITVTGYGNLQSLSDTATVSVQVSSTQELASAARQNVSTTVSAILSALGKAYGNGKSISVTTTAVSVYPQTQYNSTTGESKRTGYSFQHQLQINLQNVTSQLLAGVIDVVVNQGTEISINSIAFGLSSGVKGRLWLEGRNAAVADAQGTAQLYSKALGVELGPVVSLQEISGSNSAASTSDNPGDALGAAGNSTALASAVSIGQQTVTIQVSAVYLLLPGRAAAPAAAPLGTAGR